MMKPLRKRHLQVWIVLALILPLGIILARVSIPKSKSSIVLQPVKVSELPVIIKTLDRDDYTLHLRSNNDHSAWQLQWINKRVLTFPSGTIYKTDGKDYTISGSELIGRIESKGDYLFPLKDTLPGTLHLLLYDFIHQKELERIHF